MESRAPERTCIGCRRKKEQSLLLRVSRDQDGRLALTDDKHRHGRGAYICADTACLDAALKGDRLARSLRHKIAEAEKNDLRTALARTLHAAR